jgi:hypothetical protein
MKSSDIATPRERPASVLSGLYYRQQTDEFLTAVSSVGAASRTLISHNTSVYEFPGDVTYARYLSSKVVQ